MTGDLLNHLLAAASTGAVARVRLGAIDVHLLLRPEHVRQVFADANGYERCPPCHGPLRHRPLLLPAFERLGLAGLAHRIGEAASGLAAAWQAHASSGAPVDLMEEFRGFARAALGLCLLGDDLAAHAGPLAAACRRREEQARAFLYGAGPGPERAGPEAALDGALCRVVAGRRLSGPGSADALDLLLGGGAGLYDDAVRDELLALLVSGIEGLAALLAWACHLLCAHPEAWRRLRVENAAALGGRHPHIGRLLEMPYQKRVLEETLRLYPPAWVLIRRALLDGEVGGHQIPAGALVAASPYAIHRDPACWQDPGRFDPDRCADPPAGGFLPFGIGPGHCLGAGVAMLAAQLALAALLQRYRLEPVPGHQVVPEPLATLRPRHGVRVIVHSDGVP